MRCSVGHPWVSYPGLSLIGSPGPLTPLELQESSRQALLWGPSAPPTHCHVSTRGLTPPHWDGLLLGLVGTWGQQEDSGSCKALGVSFAGKMDWLLGDRGAWASPCGLSRKGKCGQAGNRCSEVGGRPVGEDRLSSAVPEPQHSGHCCPLSRSHIDPLVTQVSI